MDALAAQLDASTAETKLIVTDTVFSMDGNIAPLQRLVALAEAPWRVAGGRRRARLRRARPARARRAGRLWRCAPQHLIYVGTLGKAAGVAGAFVIAHETVIEWMIQRARSYIFTTAAPPSVAHAVSASLALIGGEEGEARRAHLAALIERTRALLRNTRWQPVDSHTAVQPLVIGENDATLAAMRAMDQRTACGCRRSARPPCRPAPRGCACRCRPRIDFADLARLEAALSAAGAAEAAA